MRRRYVGTVGLTSGELLHFIASARSREEALALAAELEPAFRGYPLSQVHAGEPLLHLRSGCEFATTAAPGSGAGTKRPTFGTK